MCFPTRRYMIAKTKSCRVRVSINYLILVPCFFLAPKWMAIPNMW